MKRIALTILCCLLLPPLFAQRRTAQWQDSLSPAAFSLTMVMMHDVVNPPAAARFYAYSCMAAYQVTALHNRSVVPLRTFVNKYTDTTFAVPAEYDHRLAAIYAMLEVGRQLIPSGYQLSEKQSVLVAGFRRNRVSPGKIEGSISLAKQVAAHIVRFSKLDNYGKLSAKPRYSPSRTDSSWYPTPPAYMEAVEPNWKTIRTLVLDSSNEFVPRPAVPFSTDSNSAFHRLALEVYHALDTNRHSRADIAAHWDCNPFAVSTAGHLSLGFKKINPGGHWMNIAGIAAKRAALDFDEVVLLQTLTAITLMDAFISCWHEKYTSNRIRPETYINKHIDRHWQPLLQTPPFPEYTSGHSVISTAAAELLSYFLGDNFAFTDDTEIMFELPERQFASFRQAAEEAAISRLYGGIHYLDSIENGQEEGRQIADKIIAVIRARGIRPMRP